MKLILTSEQFTLANGAYYSPAFAQDSQDSLISVAVWLTGDGVVSMQASIDEAVWVDVTNTSFSAGVAGGLQTYTECHYGLVYRIKTTVAPAAAAAQILI